ncbi:LPS export ABC transporter permease LptF [Pseudoxanthomonas sangjuensis]|uniref:LPS export ABC transporter permease LptF n=1 Tax=Pseudoxanthomonas sangjuensis TaxID=1503750 RepID=UPI001390BB7D|nr:LPS export ABC transporter permease LptF [Pseudoxanthomonas sangjuensis]KAF1708279.1 LPS export ABC transporter permease LptF [Pseudoxanthomonas sangjuensis]
MPKLDRYLFREFLQGFLATLIVLLVVSLGGVLADLLRRIAEGRVPASLLLSQLGLQLVSYLPIVVLPLSLMLGLLLTFSRLYRDAEMPVLAATGIGPRRLLKPLLMLVLPVAGVIGALSLWLAPWAEATGVRMVERANRSLVAAGLEAGKFTVLSNGGVAYVGAISDDGVNMRRGFVQRQRDGRLDVVTAASGQLSFEGEKSRYLRLDAGFRVEGPLDGGLNYNLARFASNEFALPDREDQRDENDPELLPTTRLIGDPRPGANAQLHSRLTPPLLALAFALLTLPLSRSSPRQARYGRIMLGFLVFLVGTLLMFNGTQALADGKLPPALGLWWLSLPMLALAAWFYLRDGHLSRPKRAGA